MIGTYEMTINDANGNPVNGRGKYTEVWRKQADRKWIVVADMFNSDLPLPMAPERKRSISLTRNALPSLISGINGVYSRPACQCPRSGLRWTSRDSSPVGRQSEGIVCD